MFGWSSRGDNPKPPGELHGDLRPTPQVSGSASCFQSIFRCPRDHHQGSVFYPREDHAGDGGCEQRHRRRVIDGDMMAPHEESHLRVQGLQSLPLDPGVSQRQLFSIGSAVYREPRISSKIVCLARNGVHCQPEVSIPDRSLHPGEPRCPFAPQGGHHRVPVALESLLDSCSQSGFGLPEIQPCHRHLDSAEALVSRRPTQTRVRY